MSDDSIVLRVEIRWRKRNFQVTQERTLTEDMAEQLRIEGLPKVIREAFSQMAWRATDEFRKAWRERGGR